MLRKASPVATGEYLSGAGKLLSQAATTIPFLLSGNGDGDLSSQRLAFAGSKMSEAGDELQGIPKKPSGGKSWLKGG